MTVTPITNPALSATTATPATQAADLKKRLQAVADLLKMSTDDLLKQLQSGKSLADVAKDKGVSRDALVSAIKQDFAKNAPANANVDASKLDEVVNKIVDRKGGPAGAHGHHHHHDDSTNATSSQSTVSGLPLRA
ncbi:MAG: hypothetical protein JWL83_1609 [Actinomycetia bacterium]|nr:hypothetical protein [Actinomycetes bacterium]